MARSPIARSGFRGDRSAASLQENMELLTGQRGDGLDRALTLRDMVSLGVLGVQRNGNGSVIPKPLPPVTPDGGVVEMPHAPKGFRGMGGFGAIMLEWTNPTFKGYAHTEVWRATPLANQAKPSIGEAVLIATTPATVFGDIVKPGSTFYYWIRFINLNDIPGPYSGVDGVKVSTSPDISDVIDDVGEQMKDSELIQDLNKGIEGVTAAVQENTKVIEKLNTDGSKAYQSMWNVKAQAGDIKAGIGILADSNGKSQVAVAASQFFVFDPNVEGGETKPLFAIDKGNVIIPKAYIETATIQILNAQTIVADEIKAGISIKSPVIEGGSVTGGWAGFGPGGRFNGWRTYINASGQIFTDGINAVNGSYAGHLYATSGEMKNVLIHEDCRVLGTIYANKIVGDLTTARASYFSGAHSGQHWHTAAVFRVKRSTSGKARTLVFNGCTFNAKGGDYASGYTGCYWRVIIGGVEVDIGYASLENNSTGSAWTKEVVVPSSARDIDTGASIIEFQVKADYGATVSWDGVFTSLCIVNGSEYY
ncbi:phage tail tip fiber protein [Photobacterium damselae]